MLIYHDLFCYPDPDLSGFGQKIRIQPDQDPKQCGKKTVGASSLPSLAQTTILLRSEHFGAKTPAHKYAPSNKSTFWIKCHHQINKYIIGVDQKSNTGKKIPPQLLFYQNRPKIPSSQTRLSKGPSISSTLLPQRVQYHPAYLSSLMKLNIIQ